VKFSPARVPIWISCRAGRARHGALWSHRQAGQRPLLSAQYQRRSKAGTAGQSRKGLFEGDARFGVV